MEKLFNDGWSFVKTGIDCTYEEAALLPKARVDIPHDWLIHQTKNLYETSIGWYTKSFKISDLSKVYKLCFDGVYMDSTVYINDKSVFEWKYGYSTFEADISDAVRLGENSITVRVCHKSPNSRWYSGAGIFRNIFFIEKTNAYIASDGVYFSAEKAGDIWQIRLSAETVGTLENDKLCYSLIDGDGKIFASAKGNCGAEISLEVNSPLVWDIDNPRLYTLKTVLFRDGQALDDDCAKVGFRTIEFKPDSGFYLNGRKVKLHGVCLHHDLGCLGAAVNKAALRRQLEIMREMGVNAVRTSHNMPARELVELCSEMGLLVDDEAFDMWELKKTDYDYARFFDEWYKKDVASWVKRDRNYPAVIMWSIGNEIYDTHVSERGLELTKMLRDEVRVYDGNRNAFTTIGSNYIEWDNAQKCSAEVDTAGYNYGEHLYEKHHAKYPNWCIYGSETAARVQSRGIYHFPKATAFITHSDLQCSELGNCRSGATAKTAQTSIIADRDTDFCAGQFIWTGFDYLGEPTPYSTKNAYYGQADTAGFLKDSYYLYQSAWTDKPVLHIMPYWDFNDGQLIDIVVYSNLPQVELFFNGSSCGRKGTENTYSAEWQLDYEKGELTVIGYDKNGIEKARDSIRSFGDTDRLSLSADKTELAADGTDMLFVEISALDKDGNFVANARDRVNVSVTGAARLVGLDSGDSTDYDEYKCNSKRLFSGKLLAMVEAKNYAGEIKISVSGVGIKSAELYAKAVEAVIPEGTADAFEENTVMPVSDEIPVRKIKLYASANHLDNECSSAELTAEILPPDATYSELEWSVVTNSGIPTNLAEIIGGGKKITLKANGDGGFRLRCTCNNGQPQPQVVSELEFEVSGMGRAVCDPYEFTPASLFSYCVEPPDEVTQGGVSICVEGRNIVGYRKYDFGRDGSDSFKLKLINWHRDKEDTVCFSLWKGIYGEPDAVKLGDFTYNKDFVWATYLEQEYKLCERLTGINDFSFVFDPTRDQRVSFGGFEFIRDNRAYRMIDASDNDTLYGDSFTVCGREIDHIGNNVYVDFNELCLDRGARSITVCGRTHNANDSVHFIITTGNSEEKYIMEFPHSDDFIEKQFAIKELSGKVNVRFAFLPGCDFDLKQFRFNS